MVTARKTLLAVVGLLVVSVLLTVFDGATPPQGTGRDHDSFGVLGQGLRGLYETMEVLGRTVSRSHVPPVAAVRERPGACLVLWGSDADRVGKELRHISQLGQWVEAGGSLVIAPASVGGDILGDPAALFQHLGLPQVGFETVQPVQVRVEGNSRVPAFKKTVWGGVLDSPTRLAVTARGEAARLFSGIQGLAVPENGVTVLTMDKGQISPDRVDFIDAKGVERTLAAIMPLGQGRVVIVAEPSVAVNRYLGLADNGVFMAQLLAGQSGDIVFDAYLHGPGPGGHPLHLFSRRPYGFIALMLVLTALLWGWRNAVALGPPLAEGAPSRRDVADYINAMATLFLLKKAHRFALAEIREGVVRRLARKHHLPPSRGDAAAVGEAIGKRDPDAAARFSLAVAAADALLRKKREPSIKRLTETARELTKCQ